MATILGFDIAFNHAGFCIFKDGEYFEHGSYKVSKSEDSDVRYDIFIDETYRLIQHYQPTLVLVEKAWLGKNAMVHGLISELTGIVRAYCYMNGVKFKVIPVAKYRAFFGIKNSKDAVSEFVKSKYPNLEIKNDDESDSILLSEYGSKALEEKS